MTITEKNTIAISAIVRAINADNEAKAKIIIRQLLTVNGL